MASKASRKELDEEWKSLRRGWYLGGQSFLAKLERQVEAVRRGKRRESHSGAAKREHDERAAEKELKRGLVALGVEAKELAGLPKGAPEKLVLAWWLRRRSTVPLRWVSERLQMGHYSRVTQAMRQLEHQPGRRLKRMQGALLHLEDET